MYNGSNKSTKTSRWIDWLPVICLAFSAFVFNTTEFVPVGLLPSIAKSFDMDVAHTGLLITGYAWVVTIMSLPLTVLTATFERRKLLISLFLLFIMSHILCGMASSFTLLMIGRIGIACAHAIFWAITTPMAVRLAPISDPRAKSKALAFIVTGSSLATVLGVPIGTIIGQQAGWRITFLCIGVVAFLVMLMLIKLLPLLPSNKAGSIKSVPVLFKRPALVIIYALTAITITGHFTAYTYITPFMTQIGEFSEQHVVFLLLVIGFAGIVGSVIFERFYNRFPFGIFVCGIVTLLLSLVLLYVSTFSHYTAIAVCFIWGCAIAMIGLCLQTKVLDVAPDAADVAVSMYSGIFNIGIGGGALVGSIVLIHFGASAIGFVGAVFVAISLVMMMMTRRYLQREIHY